MSLGRPHRTDNLHSAILPYRDHDYEHERRAVGVPQFLGLLRLAGGGLLLPAVEQPLPLPLRFLHRAEQQYVEDDEHGARDQVHEQDPEPETVKEGRRIQAMQCPSVCLKKGLEGGKVIGAKREARAGLISSQSASGGKRTKGSPARQSRLKDDDDVIGLGGVALSLSLSPTNSRQLQFGTPMGH